MKTAAIMFLRDIDSPGAEFLQFDGMKRRERRELDELMAALAEHGVRRLNDTFHGERDCHDRFAARPGELSLLLDSAAAAVGRFYSQRELYRRYQKQYIAAHRLSLYDVTDERQCGSRRY